MGRLLALLALFLGAAFAAEPPGYALVVYGAKAQREIAIVVEGGRVFVDGNGDGRIERPGEEVAAGTHGYFWTEAAGCDQDGKEGRFRLCLDLGRDERNRAGLKLVSTNPVEEIQDFHSNAGFIPLGDSPERAPRIPIHGPLRFVLMDHWTGSIACRRLPREGGDHEFSILVATQVLGTDAEAYVYPHLWRLQGADLPTVRMDYTAREGSPAVAAPRPEVIQCECGRRYRAKIAAPPATAVAQATLHLSFPGWKQGPLADASFELEYAPPARQD
ncbi:MAG: hypothetical protein ACT4PV_08450 [Planctomycetaceae bacterium]